MSINTPSSTLLDCKSHSSKFSVINQASIYVHVPSSTRLGGMCNSVIVSVIYNSKFMCISHQALHALHVVVMSQFRASIYMYIYMLHIPCKLLPYVKL